MNIWTGMSLPWCCSRDLFPDFHKHKILRIIKNLSSHTWKWDNSQGLFLRCLLKHQTEERKGVSLCRGLPLQQSCMKKHKKHHVLCSSSWDQEGTPARSVLFPRSLHSKLSHHKALYSWSPQLVRQCQDQEELSFGWWLDLPLPGMPNLLLL